MSETCKYIFKEELAGSVFFSYLDYSGMSNIVNDEFKAKV